MRCDVIILAGGKGTRLSGVVSDRPKPMALVNGIPFLELVMRDLKLKGYGNVILATGYMAEKIHSHFSTVENDLNIIFSEECQPLGTGGAVRLALEHVQTEHVIIINGDTFTSCDLNAFEEAHSKAKAPFAMVTTEVEDVGRYGAIQIVDDAPAYFSEKGQSGPGLINAGIYRIPRLELLKIELGLNFSFEDDFVLPNILEGNFSHFVHNGYFIDIGVPSDYERASQTMST